MPTQPNYDAYQQKIIDHYHQPKHQGQPDNHTHTSRQDNPLCGDWVAIFLTVDAEGVIKEAGWQGQGCAISLAATDILLGQALNQTPAQVRALTEDQFLQQLGLSLRPSRLKCALLGLHALQAALTPQD